MPRSHEFARDYFLSLNDDAFKQLTRVTKDSFNALCGEIESHQVFLNDSKHPQAPVWLQLAIALDRLGTNGNGASLGRTRSIWGVGTGTLDLYTSRVIIALMDKSDQCIKWPDADERRQIAGRMKRQGFPGCIGFIDGTTFPLSQKPGVNGQFFFDRKHRYSVNAQVVCDDRRRIIVFYSGWPGSSADSTVYREMMLAQDRHKPLFFSRGQYLIADSAYPADRTHNTIVPSYKKNQAGIDNEAFNTCVAHVRVVNEHTIGVLKGRWSSLRELRIQIKVKEDLERVLRWMHACVVLHNWLISFGDEWGSSDEDEPSDDEEVEEQEGNDDDAFPFRGHLKSYAVNLAREPGGILWLRGE
eukprot:jgi/Phyca11/99824/e_gw1.4.719.1